MSKQTVTGEERRRRVVLLIAGMFAGLQAQQDLLARERARAEGLVAELETWLQGGPTPALVRRFMDDLAASYVGDDRASQIFCDRWCFETGVLEGGLHEILEQVAASDPRTLAQAAAEVHSRIEVNHGNAAARESTHEAFEKAVGPEVADVEWWLSEMDAINAA